MKETKKDDSLMQRKRIQRIKSSRLGELIDEKAVEDSSVHRRRKPSGMVEVVVTPNKARVTIPANNIKGQSLEVNVNKRSLSKDFYHIDKENIERLVFTNTTFREAILTGAYFYYKGRICLYNSGVLVKDENEVKFSEKVLSNPSHFFLSYRYGIENKTGVLVRVGNVWHEVSPKEGVALRGYRRGSLRFKHAKLYLEKDCENKYEETVLEMVDLSSDFLNNGLGGGPNDSFCKVFSSYMDKRNISIKELADKTGIPERTITRMKTEINYKPSLEYVIMCCIAMRLCPPESLFLLQLAGYTLRYNNKKEKLYSILISHYYVIGTIDSCDRLMAREGIPTFSSILESRKKDK